MGSDAAVEETFFHRRGIKVHQHMCIQLLNLVDRTCAILPDIEAARPRCTAGIEALVLLRNATQRGRLLIQHCSESSKLYLAVTGERIASRCDKTRSLLETSLSQLQTMVPVALESEISQLIVDLKGTVFAMDSSEEAAGKALLALLQHDKSGSDRPSEAEAFRFAASRLQLMSKKAIVIESRSIKKLLQEVNDNEVKRTILRYFLKLLKKYDVPAMEEQFENSPGQYDGAFSVGNSDDKYVGKQFADVESFLGYTPGDAKSSVATRLPEEFKCPLSSRIMYDPVVIDSGQSFERMFIQKWFDEGHETCPVTGLKLDSLSVTPNTAMKYLISKWCKEHGFTLSDPNLQVSAFSSLDTSMNSIANLQIDLSDVSLGSVDSLYMLDSSQSKVEDGLNVCWSDNSFQRHQYYSSVFDRELESLSSISTFPWESQCALIEDVKRYLQSRQDDYFSTSDEEVVDPLVVFLSTALEKHDIRAARAGCELFLAFLGSRRDEIPSLSEGAYSVLASLLETDVTEDVLVIMGIMSREVSSGPKFAASGVLRILIGFLDKDNRKIQKLVLQILRNLSLSDVLRLHPECIPKLTPFLSDTSVAGLSIVILRNLCDKGAAWVTIAETKGSIAAIVGLLETGSSEDQEHAVSILLFLCAHHVEYCRLVMDEGVIPNLVHISVNGNERAKIYAGELLRLLKDIDYEDVEEFPTPEGDVFQDPYEHCEEKVMPPSKQCGFLRRKIAVFSKYRSAVTKKR